MPLYIPPPPPLAFPATQVSSSDANTLDDYEEGSWTPVLTFQTPGNLSVSYSVQVGRYTKIGNLVFVRLRLTTSAFTHTTASGLLRVTGLPYTPVSTADSHGTGPCSLRGYTKANFTQVGAVVAPSDGSVYFRASGSAQVATFLATGDMPTGGTVEMYASVTYEAAT